MRPWILLALVACSKPEEPKATAGTGSASVAPVVNDAAVVVAVPADGPVLVDLFRTVPLLVEVSSRVANAKIKLVHLVDRDLKTAWNSRTGELAGSWISVDIPKDVVVHEVRMTVGHTGTGPKGEDFFTMNHRITKATVSLKSNKLTKDFDVNARGLQTIAVPQLTDGTLKINIDASVPGSKPKWSEICISELELWGTAAKATPNAKPRVRETGESVAARLCDGKISKDPYPTPECVVDFGLTFDEDANDLPAPWTGVGVQDIVTHRTEHHGHLYGESIERSLVLIAGSDVWTSDVVSNSSSSDPGDGTEHEEHNELTLDVIRVAKNPKNALAIRYSVKDVNGTQWFVVTCALDRTCTTPVEVKEGRWK